MRTVGGRSVRARFRAALAGGLLALLGMAVVAVLADEAAGWRFLHPALERELWAATQGQPLRISAPIEGATPHDEVPAGWPRLLLAGRARP
jgi:hypothetical protein